MQKKTPKKQSHIPPKPRLTRAEIWVSVLSPAVVGNIVDWDLYIFLKKSSNFVAFPPRMALYGAVPQQPIRFLTVRHADFKDCRLSFGVRT